MDGTFCEDHRRLVEAAIAVQGEFALRGQASAGSVAAALRCDRGAVFTGICVETACGLGFCAEHAAVAAMLERRQTRISAIVAVARGERVLPPCGRCRELLLQVDLGNRACQVLLPEGRWLTLAALMPEHWLLAKELRDEDDLRAS